MTEITTEQIQLQVGVKILLKNPEGKYLLLHRNPAKYPEVRQKWDIVGGRIDPGKPLLENLKREIREETQLDFVNQPTLIAAQDILRVTGRHVVRLTYTGDISGEPILDDEHDACKWFELSEMKAMPQDELDAYFKEVLEEGAIT